MSKRRIKQATQRIEGAVEDAVGAVEAFGRSFTQHLKPGKLTSMLRLPTMGRRPGEKPGIDHEQLRASKARPAEPVRIQCIDYSPDRMDEHSIERGRLDEFLTERRPEWVTVRWINVDGIEDHEVVSIMARWYKLHPLAVEDVLRVPQRPKVEPYPGDGQYRARMFLIARMVQAAAQGLNSEQISIFLGFRTLLTFQQTHGDVWDAIRERLRKDGSRIRANDASFLMYALLDAVVDHFFPILEQYGDRLEQLEERILDDPNESLVPLIHTMRRELLLLRREIWPMREMIQSLTREEHECMSETTRMYLRDVYDHAVQIIDYIETCREMASGLFDSYMTAVSHRMNEVMKVLTIIATIFIPITFIAGVYGMNFAYIPETQWKWAYPAFWVVCAVVVIALLLYFRRKRWF